MSDHEEPGHERWGLVMPFVVCSSKGGPYEDTAFVAGYQAGGIDMALAAQSAISGEGMRVTVYTALVPQLDLIAMRHGFLAEAETDTLYPQWTVWRAYRKPVAQ